MLHVGLDLSRHRLDVRVLDDEGASVAELQVAPEGPELRGLAARFGPVGPVRAVIESMNGARFVHDTLELAGWDVEIADAVKVRGLAPLACKTDRIDAFVLAELSRRDLVPAIWLPDPGVRGHRERARFRLHLVHHRVELKNRIHASLIAFGHACPTSDLFGVSGRRRLAELAFPEPWASDVAACLELIDHLNDQITGIERDLRREGAAHPYVPLLMTVPGISWILAYTIAAEIGDITRFETAKKLCGYSGLCPRVYQSGNQDRRGKLAKNGPKHLRWALVEAAVHAARHPAYVDHYQRTKTRLGRQRGAKIARVEIARKLAEAIWHMLTKEEPFAPVGPKSRLAA
jgi:transposase